MVTEATLKPVSDGEWEERGLGTLVILGDADKEVKEVIGRLTAIRRGRFDNYLYDIITEEAVATNDGTILANAGEEVTVAGTSSIEGKLLEDDVGKMVKLGFVGWEKSEKGRRYKNIKVFVRKS